MSASPPWHYWFALIAAASVAPSVARGEPGARATEPAESEAPAEVLVRGERAAQAASDVTRDRRVLAAAPHRSGSDLLGTIPGTFVTQHGGEGKAHQIFFRGFDAVHGQDLEVWAGGAPVNEVSHVHGQGYTELHFLIPEVVERVRVYPGPYRAEQGDFAVAGSTEFDLGYDVPGMTAKVGAGSFGARRVFLAYRPEGSTEQDFGAFEDYRSHGFGEGRASSRTSAMAQGVVELPGASALRLLAAAYGARFGSAGVLRLDDLDAGRVDPWSSYDTDQGGHSTRHQLVAEWEGRREAWQLGIAPYYVGRQLTLRQNYSGFLEDPAGGDRTTQLNRSGTLGFRASARRRVHLFAPHDSVEVGLAGRYDSIEQSQHRVSAVTDEVTASLLHADLTATAASGWVEAALHPVRRVRLLLGARWDGISFAAVDNLAARRTRTAQGTKFGRKGTIDVGVVPGLHALASIGEGFRSPQARSLGEGERTPFTEVTAAEVGLRWKAGRGLQINGAAFGSELSDDLVFREALGRNEAAPATRRVGAVLDVVALPSPWLTSALGASYTRATFTEDGAGYRSGAAVPFVPELVIRTDLAVRRRVTPLLSRELVLGLGVATSGVFGRPLPYGERGRDVFLTDAKIEAEVRPFSIALEVFNLLDAEWFDGQFVYASNFARNEQPSLVPAHHVTVGPPRAVLLSAAVKL